MGTIQFGQLDPIVDVLVRVTETLDTRITENGDTRITNDAIGNTAAGSLVAQATYIPLNAGAYVKVNGVWFLSIVYVKYNGSWQQPNAIYKKTNGNWKRVL